MTDPAPVDRSARYVDRFGLLLGITTLAVVSMALIDIRTPLGSGASDVSSVVLSVMVGSMLLIAVRASGVSQRWRLGVDVVVAGGIVVTVVPVLIDLVADTDLVTPDSTALFVLWGILALAAPLVVVRRLLQHRRVSRATAIGAVTAYLLIAVAFTFIFGAVGRIQDAPFFGTREPTTTMMYYSLVTITTLGYGDYAAATALGRLLSTMEALIGQVYLVTFVAMIVGRLSTFSRTD